MFNLSSKILHLAIPEQRILRVLEGAVVLILSAYITYQCQQPLARELGRHFETQTAGVLTLLVLAVIALPLALALTSVLVLFAANLLPPATRAAFDVLVLFITITVLIVPTLQTVLKNRARGDTLIPAQPAATGPLNAAPAPLKVERVAGGARVHNAGTQPLELAVLFVRMTENNRSYCAGKPPSSGNKDRYTLGAGESIVFTSGNCQNGHVALTVWDTNGRRIYQTSAVLPPQVRQSSEPELPNPDF